MCPCEKDGTPDTAYADWFKTREDAEKAAREMDRREKEEGVDTPPAMVFVAVKKA